jgi:hypothetical protein
VVALSLGIQVLWVYPSSQILEVRPEHPLGYILCGGDEPRSQLAPCGVGLPLTSMDVQLLEAMLPIVRAEDRLVAFDEFTAYDQFRGSCTPLELGAGWFGAGAAAGAFCGPEFVESMCSELDEPEDCFLGARLAAAALTAGPPRRNSP